MVNLIYALNVNGNYIVSTDPTFISTDLQEIPPTIVSCRFPYYISDSTIAEQLITKLTERGFDIAPNCMIKFADYNLINKYTCDEGSVIQPDNNMRIVKVQECDLYGNVNPNMEPTFNVLYNDFHLNHTNISPAFIPNGTFGPVKETIECLDIDSKANIFIHNIEGEGTVTRGEMCYDEMIIPAIINPINYGNSKHQTINQ